MLVTMPQTLHLQQDRCRNALACFVFDAVEFDRCHHVLKDHTPTVGKNRHNKTLTECQSPWIYPGIGIGLRNLGLMDHCIQNLRSRYDEKKHAIAMFRKGPIVCVASPGIVRPESGHGTRGERCCGVMIRMIVVLDRMLPRRRRR